MSARAAARLAALGFDGVFDYVGGKKDWIASGLPLEGARSGQTRALDLARTDVPTCHPEGHVGPVRDRLESGEWRLCVVVDEDRVVHGLLTEEAIASSAAGRRVTEVMELGPSTIRPRSSLENALEHIDDAGGDSILVTTEFGELLGLLYRADVEPHVDTAPD